MLVYGYLWTDPPIPPGVCMYVVLSLALKSDHAPLLQAELTGPMVTDRTLSVSDSRKYLKEIQAKYQPGLNPGP